MPEPETKVIVHSGVPLAVTVTIPDGVPDPLEATAAEMVTVCSLP